MFDTPWDFFETSSEISVFGYGHQSRTFWSSISKKWGRYIYVALPKTGVKTSFSSPSRHPVRTREDPWGHEVFWSLRFLLGDWEWNSMHVCFAARKSRCGEGSFAGLSDFKLQEMHSGYKREHARWVYMYADIWRGIQGSKSFAGRL